MNRYATVNRFIIAASGITSVMISGVVGDCLAVVSLLLWLYMPTVITWERLAISNMTKPKGKPRIRINTATLDSYHTAVLAYDKLEIEGV